MVVKFAQNGDTLWKYVMPGTYDREAYTIREIEPDQYIVGGYEKNSNGHSDFFVFKLLDGTSRSVEWWYNYGGSTTDEVCHSIIPTIDGGFIAAGSSANAAGEDFYAVKMEANGSREWINSYGGNSYDRCNPDARQHLFDLR